MHHVVGGVLGLEPFPRLGAAAFLGQLTWKNIRAALANSLMVSSMVMFLAWTGTELPFKAFALIYPNMALDRYYAGTSPFGPSGLWIPSFSEALSYIGASYAIVAFIFLLCYVYFDRRLGI